ncbi:hypothetical protein Btru_060427 [Bulinus truncatus]|nr:hypothetical protein Btru_060427 [Bulinus truncatus]
MLPLLSLIVGATATLLFLLYLSGTFWRDIYTIFIGIRTKRTMINSIRSNTFLIDLFERQVSRRRKHPFLVFKEETYSYEDADRMANRVGRVLLKLGVATGDIVAVAMSNEPAFVFLYLGVLKIGARITLVNHHLKGEALRHSIICSGPKIVILGKDLENDLPQRVANLEPKVPLPTYVYHSNKQEIFPSLQTHLKEESDSTIDPSVRSNVKLTDPAAYILTSGTTGLPKPAIITHMKALQCSHVYSPVGFSKHEVLYLTLPLYHASGLNLALHNVISVGATLVLREKFSASHFWSDCCKYNVTSFQYIGEMLRYLVNLPTDPNENRHCVTKAIGNGLRQDIWTNFKRRFQVAHIYEFYGSTELPAGCTNFFNVPGSVGRWSPLLRSFSNLIIVRIDPNTNEPFRDQHGRCELIKPGEYGVMLAKLTDKITFDGYLGPASDTSSRIIKDILEEGDFYVNTNDVFSLDSQYNLYFKDRLGDSFRWKGENVSTAEVSNAMNSAEFVMDTNVYGVEIPGCEGKAGMAAINLRGNEHPDQSKISELGHLCREMLPGYARPRFLRFQHQMSLTSTFKQQKVDLVKDGFNPEHVKDPLYYLDRSTDEYKPLANEVYQEIMNGELAL